MKSYSNQTLYALNERWKINKFKIGLRREIEHNVGQQLYYTYAKLIEKCYIAEHSLKKIK